VNVLSYFEEHQAVLTSVLKSQPLLDKITQSCIIISNAIQNKKKILLAGNGGSAADAQHIAAEFTGRFVKERIPLPAIALTTDTSALTAIGNDYGYDKVFSRQLEALAATDDVFIAISTSGNSASILTAIKSAKAAGCKCIGLSGNNGGEMNSLCDVNIVIPSQTTARIQEMHILIGHIFCGTVDMLY